MDNIFTKVDQSPPKTTLLPQTGFSEEYRRTFHARRASNEEDVRRALRLRFQVYCVENNFEDASRFHDQLETDEFDAWSIHALLRHRASGLDVGTLRLIMPPAGRTIRDLPIGQVCRHPELLTLPAARTAEISRFAVSKNFRRRSVDGQYPDQEAPENDVPCNRRVIPMMTLGLIAAALQIGVENGLTHVCAVMDPALVRLLSRNGFHFRALGPMVEFHGLRQPCYAVVDELFDQLHRERPDVWEVATEQCREESDVRLPN